MNVKLSEFWVSNYRSCIRTRFKPHPELSCLIGYNGSGKSNILNAIQLLKSLPESHSLFRKRDSSYSRCRINATFDYGKKKIYLRTGLWFATTDYSLEELRPYRTEWNFREFSGRDKWVELPFGISDSTYLFHHDVRILRRTRARGGRRKRWQTERDLFSEGEVAATVEIGQYLGGMSYYGASQFTNPARCPTSFEYDEQRPHRSSTVRTEHGKFMVDLYFAFLSKTHRTDYDEFFNLVGPDGLKLVDKMDFKEFALPATRLRVGAGGRVTRQKTRQKLIVPSVVVERTRLSPSQLSEGTFKTLALIFYLVSDKSRLLLIEEPEVCVHHGLLTRILALIKSYSHSKQIVFTTHSDFVLDELEPENVFLVKRPPGGGTSVRAVSKALSKRDFEALKKYLGSAGNLGEFWRHGGFETHN